MIPDMPPHSYTCLAEVVQTEALRNTDDEYGVAASVLNRVASSDFPDTVCAVVYSKGQYEGVINNPTLKADPELVVKFQSSEGQLKIVEALKVLDGRTDFKGPSQLHNRVASEDPLFAPFGNFYHYHWQ